MELRDDQIIRKLNVNDADVIMMESMIRDCITEGANVIFATSRGHMDVCEKLAEEYPNVIFAHATGYKSNDTNFTNYFGRVYQARYLSGGAAGLKMQTGKLGFVASMDKSNSEVTSELNAFAQHCNTPGPQTEAEKAGVWGIGYNSNDGRKIGVAGGTLSDEEITGGIDWYLSEHHREIETKWVDRNGMEADISGKLRADNFCVRSVRSHGTDRVFFRRECFAEEKTVHCYGSFR